MKRKKNIFKKVIPTIEEETVVKVIKPKKEIINAVSVVVLNNDSEETKNLLKELQFQKKEYYPEKDNI